MLIMMMVTACLFVTITSLIFAYTYGNLHLSQQYAEAMDRVMVREFPPPPPPHPPPSRCTSIE